MKRFYLPFSLLLPYGLIVPTLQAPNLPPELVRHSDLVLYDGKIPTAGRDGAVKGFANAKRVPL